MTDVAVMEIGVLSIMVATKIAAPILVTALAVGLGVSLVQTVTQVQEVTLTFVPKFIGVAGVIALAGNWMLAEMLSFTRALFDMLPGLLG